MHIAAARADDALQTQPRTSSSTSGLPAELSRAKPLVPGMSAAAAMHARHPMLLPTSVTSSVPTTSRQKSATWRAAPLAHIHLLRNPHVVQNNDYSSKCASRQKIQGVHQSGGMACAVRCRECSVRPQELWARTLADTKSDI